MTNSAKGQGVPSAADASVVYPPPLRLFAQPDKQPHIPSMDAYNSAWTESIKDPKAFWLKHANEAISWSRPPTTAMHGSFQTGNVSFFQDGLLNASYNCVDRHAFQNADKTAIIWESDEPGHHKHISYGELLDDVCRVANWLKSVGVRKGDTVAIYMPMIPEATVSMLACARVGAVHSVVFAGFSSEALRDRIVDAKSRVVITADCGKRGGRTVHTKKIVDEAIKGVECVEHVVVFKRTGDSISMDLGRDVWWHEVMKEQRPYCAPEVMNSEDPLFILYTSGSTGKPKGLLHTTAGYLLQTALSFKYIFDFHPDDVFGCMADVGWITGHSYIVYGPLMNGATTVIFESVPTYPDAGRYWDLVQRHKITSFYTAPTAIRALRRLGDEWVKKYDLSSLRVLGSVGEPINPEAWQWYHTVVGRGQCAIVDTYWQTETGSIILTPLPGCTPTKPGSATFPFFGIQPVVVDPLTGKELTGNNVEGVLCVRTPWPSMARTVFGNHDRYVDTYLTPYKGLYFTGDGVFRDKEGYYWIRGRVDDVINVSGHRLSTAEIESALIQHPSCAEAAVIGIPDYLSGQAICCFVTLKSASKISEQDITKQLIGQVRTHIGPFASPKKIVIVTDLPKTRSGKIMRRVLRKIAGGDVGVDESEESLKEKLGDLSTLADPGLIPMLIERCRK